MRHSILIASAIISLAFGLSPAKAENQNQTNLESITKQTGTILIKGNSHMGFVSGTGGSLVIYIVDHSAVNPVNNSKKASFKGVRLEINNRTSFVDISEIDDLIKGLDYISKADKEITKLMYFEAQYKTKGGFSAVVFNNRQDKISVSYEILNSSIFSDIESINKLKEILVEAKLKLDAIEKGVSVTIQK